MDSSLNLRFENLDQFFYQRNSRHYGLSFVLLPDDLQAQQVVLDGIYLLLKEERDFILDIFSFSGGSMALVGATTTTLTPDPSSSSPSSSNAVTSHLLKLENKLYKNIYTIAKKRFGQLKEGFSPDGKYHHFYQLQFDERAALYLKYKIYLGLEEISLIMDRSNHEIITLLSRGRSELTRDLNDSSFEDSKSDKSDKVDKVDKSEVRSEAQGENENENEKQKQKQRPTPTLSTGDRKKKVEISTI